MAIKEYGDSKVDAIMWEEEDMIPTLTTMEGAKDFFENRKREEEEEGLEPGSYMRDYVSGTGNWVVIDETASYLFETPDEAIKEFLGGASWRDNVVVVDLKLLPKLKADAALIRIIFTGVVDKETMGQLTFKLAE